MKVETLIIGQGLAGTILANEMRKHNMDFAIVDAPVLSSSSKIAAGIWNPVVFKRMTSSWMIKEIIPAMHTFYKEVEFNYKEKFIYPKKILKYFSEYHESELWVRKSKSDLTSLIDENIYSPEEFDFIGLEKPKSGFSFVTESGYLDCKKLLIHTRNHLKQIGKLIESKVYYENIEEENGKYRYEDIISERIIFCEGWLGKKNPFFRSVQFKPAKGEILIIESNDLQEEHIVNKGIFILPIGNERFICGATYEWNDLNDLTTEAKQNQLEKKLKDLITCNYKIIDRLAGVRPSTIDRRPVIGSHPEKKNIYMFNGFGTKAVMLAPYFAEQFVEHLKKDAIITKEVNVARFFTNL